MIVHVFTIKIKINLNTTEIIHFCLKLIQYILIYLKYDISEKPQ